MCRSLLLREEKRVNCRQTNNGETKEKETLHWTLLPNEEERKEGSLDVVLDMIIILFSTFLSFSGKSVLISGVGWNLFFVICSKVSQLDGKKIQITNHLVSQARPGPELFPSSPLASVFL